MSQPPRHGRCRRTRVRNDELSDSRRSSHLPRATRSRKSSSFDVLRWGNRTVQMARAVVSFGCIIKKGPIPPVSSFRASGLRGKNLEIT